MVGLIIKFLEYIISESDIDKSGLSSAGRILWGVAYTFAIIKTIKIGIASKYFGPIILSINAMMVDVGMFLITFFVVMLAFACGVSYMFNYLQDPNIEIGSSTSGIFTYFFWVLLQVIFSSVFCKIFKFMLFSPSVAILTTTVSLTSPTTQTA